MLAACSLAAFAPSIAARANSQQAPAREAKIEPITPPENDFFTKQLSFHGILIKAPSVVDDAAMYALYDRMATETANLPVAVTNLAAAGAEIHIIGRDQVTTDLPEWRHDKHVPLDEYNGLTRDQRTRGMGGLITSCAEENLLNLPQDRYRGRDICMHEFAHNIEGAGMQRSVRAMFDNQYQVSKSKGLWINSYAGSNPNEYFAELTMWYFGTHGDLNMTGPKPENGPEGLKKYDPDAYKLFDDFYSGKIAIEKVEPRPRPAGGFRREPRDSQPARALVARLTAYKVGETKLADFFADAGMASASDTGKNGWHVAAQDAAPPATNTAEASYSFRIFFRKSETEQGTQAQPSASANPATPSTNPSAQSANTTQPRPSVDRLVADLEFKSGVLSAFKWDN
ncbi:MAG TPA: hypothetical protein VFO34_09450 [Candidatus Acidoferrales bacterium]|nr:hypothetical protein [Candidatus Acidoferrales bacterium]